MTPFDISFSIGDTDHLARVTPEIKDTSLIYTCLINSSVLFSIRKNNENRWENQEGNASALCRLIGWEIDHYLKRQHLKSKRSINFF
jgi:hypothetical protein